MTYYEAGMEILKTLEKEGFEAYFVGGFVRDYLLHVTTNDIDITSSATPHEIKSIFKTKPIGEKFGTVLVYYDEYCFEVTTFRQDTVYNDNRHPDGVIFTRDVMVDIKRRDFTINALLWDANGKINDYCDGLNDIKNKIIRAIGNPYQRFEEDALRILRAFSFVSKLGFDIEEETKKAIFKAKKSLLNISSERIVLEMKKITSGKYREKAFALIRELEVHKELRDLEKPILNYVGSLKQLFVLSYYYNGFISDFWKLSIKNMKIYEKAAEMLKKGFSSYDFVINGYEVSKLAYEMYHNDFMECYMALPIKTISDIVVKGKDLNCYVEKEKISEVLKKIAYEIVNGKIRNDKQEILEEVKKWNI